MNTDNRKIKITKKALKESLIELLKIKPISKITIKELCQNADINRSTFYVYYASQYDLLEHIENHILEKLDVIYSTMNLDLSVEKTYEALCCYFEYIQTEFDFFKIMFGDNGDLHFVRKTLVAAEKNMFNNEMPDSKSVLHMKYLYIASGINGLIQSWVEQDNPMLPKELARIAANIVNAI